MPETACLHIQARQSDPIRVVELPGASVRIGRAPFCEVLLPEPALAEEECQLRRRGATWHLVPMASSGAMTIEGRVVDGPRPLPYGVALQVGDFSLTLRPGGATPPEWRTPASTSAVPPPPARAEVTPASNAASHYRPPRDPAAPRIRASIEAREKQWEARWKAAAERLGARPGTPPPPAAPVVEAPRSAERLAGWRSVDLPRRESARAPKRVNRPLDPATFPSLRAVEVPSAYPSVSRPAPTAPRPSARVEPPVSRAAEKLLLTQEDEAVFIPPSELDWAQAEARERNDGQAPPPRPARDVDSPVADDEVNPRANAENSIEDTDEAPSEPSPVALTEQLWQGFHEQSLVGAPDEDWGAYPESSTGVRELPDGCAAPVADSEHVTDFVPTRQERPRSRALAGIFSLWSRMAPHRLEPEAEPAVPGDVPDEDCAAILSPQETVAAERPGEGEPRNAPSLHPQPDAARPTSPEGSGEEETASSVETGLFEPSDDAAAPVSASGQAAPALSEMPPAVTEEPPQEASERIALRRRSVFARRRAKPATRTPRLGSVRVVPREELHVAAVEPKQFAPEAVRPPTRNPSAESPRQREAWVPPVPPPAGDPGPFAARTWQADTGAWAELSAPVTTSTWHAGVGPTARPSAEAGPNHAWPSARDILAARSARQPAQTAPKVNPRRPVPTVAREPEHIAVPLWLGWLPLTLGALAASVVGVALAWTWSLDARTAGVVAHFLAHSKAGAKFPLEPEQLPAPSWWGSSGGALARRAVALARSEGGDPDEVRGLLTAASQASALDTTARLGLARLPLRGEDDVPARNRSAGLSRDVLTLAWTGRQLVKAGQKESAVRAYRRALELAATAEIDRVGQPSYNDDPQVRRYTLPGEELIGPVVRDMASHSQWTFEEWSAALPSYALVPLVAARQLREHDRTDSDALLDRLVGDEGSGAPPSGSLPAVHFAARAEAFALKEKWAQAQALYQEAIDRMPVDLVRRSWQVNLADVALRQSDEPARQKALEAANNHDPNDPITLRVVDLQKGSGDRAPRTNARTRDESVTRSTRSLER
ncbi:MAG: hypothetical protein P4L84_14470 [Isosphaeraceae bacterium]|nr:hypothetical protein [Isosphaeraceae bacterium]